MRLLLACALLAGCTVNGGPIDCPSKQRPSARSGVGAVIIPATNQIYALGGTSALGPVDELWRYTFGACGGWYKLTTASSPGARAHYAVAYDSKRNRIIYIGGDGASTNDVWALDADKLTFTNLAAVGNRPTLAASQVAAYDEQHDRIILAGIATWSLDFGTSDQGLWTPIDTRSLQAPSSVVVDPTRSLMLAFDPGGLHAFSFLTGAWQPDVRMQGDIPTAGAKLVWDAIGKQLLVVDVQLATGQLDATGSSALFTRLPTTNDPPPRADAAVAISGQLLWMFGGVDGNACTRDDLWLLDLSSGAWQNAQPATTCQ